MTAEVMQLRPTNPLTWELQMALWEVCKQERFQQLDNATVVGVLEYLKWNVINMSTD